MNSKDLTVPSLAFISVIIMTLLLLLFPATSEFMAASSSMTYGDSGNDLLNDYLTGILWAIACGSTIYFWPVTRAHKRALLWLWAIRTFVCLIFMLIYERYYGLDTDGYYTPDWEFVLTNFKIGEGQNNVRQLTWLLFRVVPNSFHAAKVTFSMIGLFATYLFYKAAVFRLGKDDIRLFYLCGLIPSVLLWSSLLGKDPICLLGMALYVFGVCGWYCRSDLSYFMPAAMGMLISIYIRPWFGLIMGVPIFIMMMRMRKRLILRTGLVAVMVMLMPIFASNIKTSFKTETVDELMNFRRNAAVEFEKQGSGFKMHEITGNLAIVLAAPYAIFTALFRPLPWEAHNPFAMMAALENCFLLFLLFRAIKRTRLQELLDPFVLWLITLTCMWAVLYGLVSYNFGALVRFKLQILPVLVGLLLLLARKRSAKAVPSGRPRVPAAL